MTTLVAGTDVGGYVVDGELGSGSMGVVYAATHPLIGKRAAIKVLKPELSTNPAAVERFILEARAVNQIGHPNIVDIFGFGTLPDGRSYYVMDLLVGESLRRRLERGGPLHVAEAATILDEVASALIAAHDKGIIHRDLKPDNVFIVTVPGRWPEVRILDWGLLKLSSTQSAVGGGKYKTLAGSVLGTPVYMSPEQARASERVDFRTDIYSMGVMAYEILSGEVPFKRDSSMETMLAHQDEPVPPLAAKCPALPEELVQLIEAMLSKEPEGRPTLAAVRTVIKRLRGNKIPTMTAAGLQLPGTAPMSFVEPPTNSHPTLDGNPHSSLVETLRREMPLPPPPLTPIGGETPGSSLPKTPIPAGGVLTLAGHSMPPIGTRSPSVPLGTQVPPAVRSPSYPQLPQLPPTPLSQGSQPPQYSAQPASLGPWPARDSVPPPPDRRGSLVVIVIVAVIATAVGVVLLLAT